MKNFWISTLFIMLIVLLTGFRKNNSSFHKINVLPSLRIADASIVEGNAGQRTVEIKVILSQVPINPVSIKYSTRNGTASAGSDYIAANGSLNFSRGEMMKKIPVQIIGEIACESSEKFEISLSDPSGAVAVDSIASVTIVNDDCIGGSLSVYEVKLSYVGYTSFFGNNTDECGIRRNGLVELRGLLSGIENVGEYDDITYTGDLEMTIDMDICSAHRLANGEDDLCGMRVCGSGTVFTVLEIYFGSDTTGAYDGRGGYIKIESKDTSTFARVVTGGCSDQLAKELTMVPNKSISSVFNGKELPMLLDRTLKKGIHRETDEDGNITEVLVLRKIR